MQYVVEVDGFDSSLPCGAMYDWCVLYLKQEIGMPQAQGALAMTTVLVSAHPAEVGASVLLAPGAQRVPLGGPADQ
ncbi:MAG: hypothetical protein IV094_11935 [Vitreoscilla sp.]|nr:hypothetical protein [Vitreoscilla sp.]